ncbi:MAG: type III secretion system cytoplasmic ring protein SctQ [Pseudomonadota bacterium]
MNAQLAVPFRCPRVTRDALTDRNILCRRHVPARARWLGATWAFRVTPPDAISTASRWLEMDWGGARVFVGVSPSVLDDLARRFAGAESIAQLPQDIALAVLEAAGAELATTLERASRKHVRVTGMSASRPSAAPLEAFGWRAASDAGPELTGELLLDDTARRYLASQMREVAIAPDRDPGWHSLVMPVRLVAGWTDLPARSVSALALRDVILLDECFIGSGDTLLAQLGPSLGFRCELKGNSMEVMENVQEVMSDIEGQETEDGQTLVDDVPVRLTFDMGERAISFRELRALEPGFIFNLGRDPRSTVSVRANGHLVGEGELVDIEGRIGVSIVRLRAAS